jgi:UDPglucose 6-dehydrogenase
MKIAVIGGGYVGLVLAAGMAEIGHSVKCAERDELKRETLNSGESPIYEVGLGDLIREGQKQNLLKFVEKTNEAIEDCELIFIAVGTPSDLDGSANLSAIEEVTVELGSSITRDVVIAVKSTVPVGTCSYIENTIRAKISERGLEHSCNVVSNPEFLKEGAALRDFRRPDRIVIGSNDDSATSVLERAYAQFVRNHERIVLVDRESSELGKYASNAMLASRISFMNELSAISEVTGADIEQIRAVMGSDKRIGPDFLYAGPGFGGSCFPKDIRALLAIAKSYHLGTPLLNAILEVNETQKSVLARKSLETLGSLKNKKIAIWGLSFKPNTDDTRESPSLNLIESILSGGADVSVFDPVVKNLNATFDKSIQYCEDKYSCANGADLLILVTEWAAFKNPDFSMLSKNMRKLHVIDGRNIWEKSEVEKFGFTYEGIGR